MERRRFLELALTVSVSTAATGGGLLLLTGCGSSSGGTFPGPLPGAGAGGSLGTRFVTVNLVLPPSFSLPVSGLAAQTGLGKVVPIQTNGTFSVPLLDTQTTGPTLAWVRAGDDVVLLGFVGPDAATISTQSTAIALLYLALGGFSLPQANKNALLAAVSADAALSPLVQTLERRLAANPRALVQGDAEVGMALKAALEALGVSVSRAAAALKIGAMASPSPVRGRAAADAQLLITPTGLQSNVEILQADAAQSFLATNHSRRYCRVFAYETATKSKDGIFTALPKPKPVNAAGVALPSTSALGIFSTVKNFISGQTAFVPVSTAPITLEKDGAAAQTLFDIFVLGASGPNFDPPFYSDPRYADFVAGWREAQGRLNLTSWLADVVFGLFLEIWGLRDIAKNEAAIEAAVTNFKNEELAVFSGVLLLATQGKFQEATKNFLLGFAEQPAVAVRLRAVMAPLFSVVNGAVVPASEAAAGARVVLKMLSAALNAAGSIIGLGDLGAVFHDLATADAGDEWSATLVARTVRLDPTTASIKPGDSLKLTASVPNSGGPQNGGITVRYHWTVAATFAVLTDTQGGKSGRDFETDSTTVSLVTTPSDQSDITVTVEAISVSADGSRSSIGTATAKVTINTAAHVATTFQFADIPGVVFVSSGVSYSYVAVPTSPTQKGSGTVVYNVNGKDVAIADFTFPVGGAHLASGTKDVAGLSFGVTKILIPGYVFPINAGVSPGLTWFGDEVRFGLIYELFFEDFRGDGTDQASVDAEVKNRTAHWKMTVSYDYS